MVTASTTHAVRSGPSVGRRAVPVLVFAALISGAGGSAAAQTGPCQFRGAREALAERPSPLDSVAIPLGGGEAKLCYGRPSTRGREIVGVQDPFGAPWRLGANEPTTLHVPFPADIGGVVVGPGSYSLYAIPDTNSWTIVVNGNTNRWGIPIGADVRSADIGSFVVPTAHLADHVEVLAFDFEPNGTGGGDLVYRWEHTTFRIPVTRP